MIRPHFDVVLASGSPRRKELLARLFPDFEIVVPEVDEDSVLLADPWQRARELAWRKASSAAESRRNAIVIGADTIVALADPEGGSEWQFLAKPGSREEACKMLRALSAKTHAVITGVALIWPGGAHNFAETSWATFRELSEAEILAYVATGEPKDKAGAYAIQGGAKEFVTNLEGSLSNVIGLPIEELRLEMLGHGIADEAGFETPLKEP